MADLLRVYIDSCCFIDMVKTKLGRKLATDREPDAWHLKKLLEASRDKEIICCTSTLTIAECSHDGEAKISAETKTLFERLLKSGQYVQLVQLTRYIGSEARDLRWNHGIRVKGADAVHIESALNMRCSEMLSSNGKLARLAQNRNTLAKLGLQVRRGKDTACHPDKYRQMELANGKNGKTH